MIVILTSYHNIPFSSCEHTWSLREALTLFRGVHRDANPPPAARPRTLREALVYGGRDIALWVPFKLYDIGDYSVALVSGGVGENEVAEWAEVPPTKTPQSTSTTPPYSSGTGGGTGRRTSPPRGKPRDASVQREQGLRRSRLHCLLLPRLEHCAKLSTLKLTSASPANP